MTSRREWHAQTVPARVLIVDDEPSITDAVATALRYEGFDDERGGDRPATRCGRPRSSSPTSIILDIMLPDLDGLRSPASCARCRERVPVIFLSARDATRGQDRRAVARRDDYVAKPFSLGELVARVHARSCAARSGDGPATCCASPTSSWTRTPTRCAAPASAVELTPTEFSLLRFLLANPRRVLSKRQILDHVWHYDFGGDANIVETYV